MYSRQQASQLKQKFWTSFGLYMKPVLSAESEKINWINYKTGIKDIYFRMFADNKKASISIELNHNDPDLQLLYLEKFKQYKNMLDGSLNEEWTWMMNDTDENGKIISRIYKEKNGISIFRQEDWPELISFFKPRIIALDEFWSSVKYGFEDLL